MEKTSDIDLAVFARDWQDKDINLCRDALEEEIKTPLKFDLVGFYGLSKEALKKKILKEGVVLYESGKD